VWTREGRTINASSTRVSDTGRYETAGPTGPVDAVRTVNVAAAVYSLLAVIVMYKLNPPGSVTISESVTIKMDPRSGLRRDLMLRVPLESPADIVGRNGPGY
jgi:hypothetical protein